MTLDLEVIEVDFQRVRMDALPMDFDYVDFYLDPVVETIYIHGNVKDPSVHIVNFI